MEALGPWQPIQPAPVAEAKTKARQIIEQAEAEAARIREETEGWRTQTLAGADHEAKEIIAHAHAEADSQQKRRASFDTWMARAVIAGAVGLTASGEYSLARTVGFDREVAWLLPAVIDIYVIQAFRRHRDIASAIGLTIAANVIYHLAAARGFGLTVKGEPQWWLVAVVASIASLILWRIHRMQEPLKPRQERRLKPRQQVAAPAPASATTTPVDRQEPAAKSVPATAKTPAKTGPANSAKNAVNASAKSTAATANSQPPAPANKPKTRGAKKAAPRRSMDEWVALAGPVFHTEFARLRRNPTASEFANAIEAEGLGRPSDSTAKNIRAEILDRAELPALD